MNTRLQHDAAFAMATALLEIVENCIREDERRDAFAEFYRVVHAGIEAFCVQDERMRQRLKPSNN
jgi:hypothetical protein